MGSKEKLKLSTIFSDYLAELPEQGMGFQIVEIELKNGVVLANRIVYNSIYIELEENEMIDNQDIKSIKIQK